MGVLFLSSLLNIITTPIDHCAEGPNDVNRTMRVQIVKIEEVMCTHARVVQMPEVYTGK